MLKPFRTRPDAPRRLRVIAPKRSASVLGAVVFTLLPLVSWSLQVVSSTPDLAAVAKEVGGTRVSVHSLSQANRDPHGFEVLPQHVVAVRRADVYLKVGAGLDPWGDELLRSANNARIIVLDCSHGLDLMHDEADHSGHEHARHAHEAGNPHYWLRPSNIPKLAAAIAGTFQEADPVHTGEYAAGLERFRAAWDSAQTVWAQRMIGCRGVRVVTHHRAWDYLAREYGLEIVGTVEPSPGAEPSPASLARLQTTVRREQVRLLLLEPYESPRLARLLQAGTSISVVTVPPSVGGAPESDTIFSLFDVITRAIGSRCTSPHP